MDLRIIKTDGRYRRYRAEIEKLVAQDPDSESPAGARLELLAKLVEDYERSKFAFSKPDPVDALIFRVEQQGLRQKDIADLLGGKNREPAATHRVRKKRPGGGTPK